MKVIYLVLFLIMNIIRSFASHDVDRPVERENTLSFRLDQRSRFGNVKKPDPVVTSKEALDVVCLVKERAVVYEQAMDPEEQVLRRSPLGGGDTRSNSAPRRSGGFHRPLPPRYKRASVGCAPIGKNVVQVAPHPGVSELYGMETASKYAESPKADRDEDLDDCDLALQNCSTGELAMRCATNIGPRDIEPLVFSSIGRHGSGISCLDTKAIRLSGPGKYKPSRASSYLVQLKGVEEDKLDEEYLTTDPLNKGDSVERYKRDTVPDVERPMYHCARRSLGYGGASSVYIPDNKDTNKAPQLMRSISDMAERDGAGYAVDLRSTAMNMLVKLFGKVCLVSESNGLDDGDVLKLEFILLFANVNEQYLLNPDYKSAEFCKLLMSRKYLLVFLLNNEHMLRTGKISHGTAGMIFRHHMLRSHVLSLVNALKSSTSTSDAVLSPMSPGRLDNAIGAPQVIQNEIMTKSEFALLSKAFLDLYRLCETGCCNTNQGSASSSSSLRDRSRSTSSALGRRMSATSDYPKSSGKTYKSQKRSGHVAAIRELGAVNNGSKCHCCVYCVIL